MSDYTVVWLREAIDELGEIWLAAADRNAVTEASEELDQSLQDDAEKKGKPLRSSFALFAGHPAKSAR